MTNVQPGVNPEEHNDSQPTAGEKPADRPTFLPCPPWCTTDHAEQDRRLQADLVNLRARTGREDDWMPDWMARYHTRTVAEIANPEDAVQPVKVTLFRDDSMVDPDPNRAVISAEHADSMHPTTAVELAAGLLAATAILRDDPVLADALARVGSRVRTGERQVDESIDGGDGHIMTGDEFVAYLDRLDAEAAAEEKGEPR